MSGKWIDKERHSSLLLQILLSLNVRGAVVWILINSVFVWNETPDWDYWVFAGNRTAIRYALILFASALATCVECGRLYFGYSGNLREHVPDYAAFLLLSTFFSLPSQTYLMYAKWDSAPQADYYDDDDEFDDGRRRSIDDKSMSILYIAHLVIQSISLVWLMAEIMVGTHGIRKLAHIRAQQYHVEHSVKQRQRR